jgi:hypothetical protein
MHIARGVASVANPSRAQREIFFDFLLLIFYFLRMEVHHHAHSRRKKWSHYFWEFLMLFLAVFCGFLAEYQLEHKIEKNKEKQFMKSMIEDLKTDTAAIIVLNQIRSSRHEICDSIRAAIIDKKYSEKGAAFYYWGRVFSLRGFFFSSDGTMQQLKNSGGLRLISNKYIADKIISYDVLYRDIQRQQDLEEEQLTHYRIMAGSIFDAAVFTRMTNLKSPTVIERPAGNPQLLDGSPDKLNALANSLNYWTVGSSRLRHLLEQLREKAEELIGLIKKEYHLK